MLKSQALSSGSIPRQECIEHVNNRACKRLLSVSKRVMKVIDRAKAVTQHFLDNSFKK